MTFTHIHFLVFTFGPKNFSRKADQVVEAEISVNKMPFKLDFILKICGHLYLSLPVQRKKKTMKSERNIKEEIAFDLVAPTIGGSKSKTFSTSDIKDNIILKPDSSLWTIFINRNHYKLVQ